MIGPTGAVRVLLATRPVDFRKGAEGLPALVRETMRANSFDGAIYVFRAKRADRIKLVYWDGTGVCLLRQTKEFEVLPRRWVVERTFAWLGRCRGLAKDFDATIDSAVLWFFAASLRRLTRHIAKA